MLAPAPQNDSAVRVGDCVVARALSGNRMAG